MCILARSTAAATPAHSLSPQARCQLTLAALAGQPITDLAQQHQVSRTFVYQQLRIARAALDQAFAPLPQHQEAVLFYLPVTRSWLRQLVLALVLIGHCSLRRVVELLADLFAYRMALGTVHNAVAAARQVNAASGRGEGTGALTPGGAGGHPAADWVESQQPVMSAISAETKASGGVCTTGVGPGLQNQCSTPITSDASSIPLTSCADETTRGPDVLAFCLAFLNRKSPDLALLVERWDTIPEAIRAGIMAMVKTAWPG